MLPFLAGLEVEEEGIVVDESGGDSLVQELGMPVKHKNKITNYSSLRILLHQKNFTGNCSIHYPADIFAILDDVNNILNFTFMIITYEIKKLK
jgi:hypothetical protein